MATDIYPMWSPGPSSDIAQQAAQWAGVNYANQNANIARQQAADQQDIQNRQNYFQAERENANQAQRQQAQQEDKARKSYEFGQTLALQKQSLAQQDALGRLKYTPDAVADDAANKASIAKLFMGKGEGHSMTDEEISLATGAPLATVAKVATPFRLQFPEKAVDALNNQTQAMRLKNPDRFDSWNVDVIEGLKNKLPPELRDRVSYDPEAHSWKVVPAQVKLRNPFGDVISVAPENAQKVISGWQKAAASGAYNFGPTSGTGTTQPQAPPTAPAPPAPPTAPQNPYVPGRRYGNLRYIGGDPNAQTSWQPVR